MDETKMSRRDAFGVAGGLAGAGLALGAGLTASEAQAAAPKKPLGKPKVDFVTKIDFKDPKWCRDTYARLDADLDPTKVKCGWIKGKVYSVRPNEKVRPLFLAEGFSFVRMHRTEDGSWRRLLREVVFYRDLETGKLMDEWKNPFTGETVKVVPIANDPFNFTIGEYAPEPPSYGGLNKDKPPRRPFLLDCEYGPTGNIIVRSDVDLFYPSALQPGQWPRESAGVMNQVSEHFIYSFKAEDAANPHLTALPYTGAWNRITPWLPWMMMGQAEGNLNYFTYFQTVPNGVAGLPADLVAKARAMGDKWLTAPETDYGPSLSSLENYAHQQKPSAVPAGWTQPATPAAAKPFPPKP
ncbi:MAG TPA: DUF1838 family protein [Novosphingobium sp.]|nr:DUF1838 family protein [Novosphingobium sp.]